MCLNIFSFYLSETPRPGRLSISWAWQGWGIHLCLLWSKTYYLASWRARPRCRSFISRGLRRSKVNEKGRCDSKIIYLGQDKTEGFFLFFLLLLLLISSGWNLFFFFLLIQIFPNGTSKPDNWSVSSGAFSSSLCAAYRTSARLLSASYVLNAPLNQSVFAHTHEADVGIMNRIPGVVDVGAL